MKLFNFIEETKKEVLKISWLNRKELSLSTLSVFVIVGIFSLFFLVVDLMVSNLVTYILEAFS
jgi:preprotein translocase subunit SecE